MTSNVDKILRDAIEKKSKEYDEKIKAKDYEGVAKMYPQNAKLMPPTGETIVGANDILAFLKKSWGEANAELTSKVEEVTGDGDWAYSRGTYKVASGGAEVESGKFVIVWKKVNNEYQPYTDIWNVTKKA